MTRTTIIIAIYAIAISYPAYLQTARVVNAKLDTWAAERVAATMPKEVQTSLADWGQ